MDDKQDDSSNETVEFKFCAVQPCSSIQKPRKKRKCSDTINVKAKKLLKVHKQMESHSSSEAVQDSKLISNISDASENTRMFAPVKLKAFSTMTQMEAGNVNREHTLEQGENLITLTNLPDYTKRFGQQEVKVDRYKLGIPHINLNFLIVDEIALEGLDGITIQALMVRLSTVLKQPLPFPSNVNAFIWDSTKLRRDIQFFQLKEPRPPLVIFDRYETIDPDLGLVIDPSNFSPGCPENK